MVQYHPHRGSPSGCTRCRRRHVIIKDSIANSGLYTCISDGVSRALTYLHAVTESGFQEVSQKTVGPDVVALHQEYRTEPVDGRLYENHTSHIDVQFVLAGEETIRVTDVHNLSAATDHNSEDDVTFYELATGTDVRLSAGDFVILFPHDAHIPKLESGPPAAVRKVVVKIAAPTEAL
jgi:YhcH/YjgK/YiaL family protein